MEYTEKVHSYTLNVSQGIAKRHFSILSVIPLDIEKFLSDRDAGCSIDSNGLVDAVIVHKFNSPWDTIIKGYKMIHTCRDSRGVFSSNVYVPCNWDENHPMVKQVKGIAKEETKATESYYSRLWV